MANHRPGKSSPTGSLPFCSVTFQLALFLTIVPNGSVKSPFSQASAILLSVALVHVLLSAKFKKSKQGSASLVLFLLSLITAVVSLQTVPIPLSGLAHPVWAELGGTFPVSGGYLTVNPSRSLHSLPGLILPFLTVIAVLLIAQERQAGRSLWYGLTGVGLAVLLLSVVLDAFFPKAHFFSNVTVANSPFTGVFFNRNVASAFFVLTAFAVLGTLGLLLEKDRRSVDSAPRNRKRTEYTILRRGLLFLFFLACIIAVIATKSRAGTLIGLPLLLLCLTILIGRETTQFLSFNSMSISLVLIIVTTLIMLLGTLVLFGEPVLTRAETEGTTSRHCVYKSTLAAIGDHWAFGTGLGTFQDIFPSYRSADCGSASKTWHRAHNSFLEFTLNTGIPGLIFMLALIGLIFERAITGLRKSGSMAFMPIILLTLSAYLMMHSMVDFPLQIPGISHYAAALIACSISLSQPRRVKFVKVRREGNEQFGTKSISTQKRTRVDRNLFR